MELKAAVLRTTRTAVLQSSGPKTSPSLGLDKKVVVFNMSGRKAELERKRKRLEEIKKAREEKKKVNMINWIPKSLGWNISFNYKLEDLLRPC